jgi:subtilisin family serine protease
LVDPADGDEARAGQAIAASSGLSFVKSLGDGMVVLRAADGERADTAALSIRAAMQRAGIAAAAADDDQASAAAVAATPSSLVSQAVTAAVASARVRLVEEDRILRTLAVASECPSGTSCPGLWGMTAIRAPQTWALVAGAQAPASFTVRGSVIDTGGQYEHVELDTQLDRSSGVTFWAGASVGDGSDDHGHGTHVSGTIAGEEEKKRKKRKRKRREGRERRGRRERPKKRSQKPPTPKKNQKTGKWGGSSGGIAGIVGSPSSLAHCKFLSAEGSGYTSDAILCIKHLASKNAALVINNSWGGTGRSQALFAAIRDYVCNKGGIFLAAAGNDGALLSDNGGTYPARYSIEVGGECVLPVAATDSNGALAWFSNYGPEVQLAAPGVGIRSSVWTNTSTTATAAWSGTSMATPHVTGVALLLKNAFPSLTGTQIKQILISTATGSVSGIAGGILNAEAAFLEAQRVAGDGGGGGSTPPPPPPPPPVLTCLGTKTIQLSAADNNCDTGVAVRAEHVYTASTSTGQPTVADTVTPPIGSWLSAGDSVVFVASLAGAGSCSTTVSVVGCPVEQAPDQVACFSPTYTLTPGQCRGIVPPENDLFVLTGGSGRGSNARGTVGTSLPADGLLGPGVHLVVVTATAGGAHCTSTVTVQPCVPVVVPTTTRAPVRLPTAAGTCLASTDDATSSLVTAATLGRGAIGINVRTIAARRSGGDGGAPASTPLKPGKYNVQVVYPGGVVSSFSTAAVNIGVGDSEAPVASLKPTVAVDARGYICAVAASARATSACLNVATTGTASVVQVSDNCGAQALTRRVACSSGTCPARAPAANSQKVCVPVSATSGRVEASYSLTVTDKSGRSATVSIPIAAYHSSKRPAGVTCYSA